MLSFVLLLQVLMIISITLLVSDENNPKGRADSNSYQRARPRTRM